MISVPVGLLITQWVVLFALGALVLVMYRQLAHLLHLSGSARDAGGLQAGVVAPTFDYRQVGGTATYSFTSDGRPALLLFSDPRCGACDKALEVVEKLTRRDRSAGTQVLVVTDADEVAVAANQGFNSTALDVALVDKDVVSRQYRVSGTPLLMSVDAAGKVRSSLSGADEAALRRFIKESRGAVGAAQPVGGENR